MKKIIAFLSLILVLFLMVGCKREDLTLIVPSGIPLIAVGGCTDKLKIDTTEGAQVLKSELMKGDYNAIVAPINLGVGLYNQGSIKYKMAYVITSSNIYIVSRKTSPLSSINDLEGKTVYSYGEGQPADKTLKYLQDKSGVNFTIFNNGIDAVSTVVASYFVSNGAEYILCAEPYVSNIQKKLNIDINVLDLSVELKKLGDDSLDFVPLACLYLSVNNTDNENKEIIRIIKENVDKSRTEGYVNKLLSVDKSLYPLFSSLGKDVLSSVLPQSGIVFKSCKEHNKDIEKYLSAIAIKLKDKGLYYEE